MAVNEPAGGWMVHDPEPQHRTAPSKLRPHVRLMPAVIARKLACPVAPPRDLRRSCDGGTPRVVLWWVAVTTSASQPSFSTASVTPARSLAERRRSDRAPGTHASGRRSRPGGRAVSNPHDVSAGPTSVHDWFGSRPQSDRRTHQPNECSGGSLRSSLAVASGAVRSIIPPPAGSTRRRPAGGEE